MAMCLQRRDPTVGPGLHDVADEVLRRFRHFIHVYQFETFAQAFSGFRVHLLARVCADGLQMSSQKRPVLTCGWTSSPQCPRDRGSRPGLVLKPTARAAKRSHQVPWTHVRVVYVVHKCRGDVSVLCTAPRGVTVSQVPHDTAGNADCKNVKM